MNYISLNVYQYLKNVQIMNKSLKALHRQGSVHVPLLSAGCLMGRSCRVQILLHLSFLIYFG